MAIPVQFSVGGRTVGSIDFVESDVALRERGARRTADGFVFTLPARLTLDWQAGDWQPLVSDLRAFVFVDDNSGTELGVAHDVNWYSPSNPRLENRSLDLEWRGSLDALQVLEKLRGGGPPKLWIRCFGQVTPIFYPSASRAVLPKIRGVPERIYGDVHVSYPQETWVTLMGHVGVIGNILVEVPVRKDFPADWKEIYEALSEAKGNLARGGDDGWKGCVGAVRLALERWQNLEKEDLAGWQAPKVSEREGRSKEQRADAIRWHLLQFAHLSPHTSADKWRRNDAILAFSTLAALLAERDP